MDIIATIDGKTGEVKKVVSHITVVGIRPDVSVLVRELRRTMLTCSAEEFADKHLAEVSDILNNKQITILLNEAMRRAGL